MKANILIIASLLLIPIHLIGSPLGETWLNMAPNSRSVSKLQITKCAEGHELVLWKTVDEKPKRQAPIRLKLLGDSISDPNSSKYGYAQEDFNWATKRYIFNRDADELELEVLTIFVPPSQRPGPFMADSRVNYRELLKFRPEGKLHRGFISLFDGKTLKGWRASPGGKWEVKDGVLLGTCQKVDKRHGILFSEKEYSDFILRAKFRILQGNSGFYFRAENRNTPIRAYGFQAEIDRTQNTGGLYETGGRAWVARPDQQVIKERKYLPGEWSDLEIHAGGKNVSVLINGILSTELKKDPGRTKGFFGLQLHGGQDMHVEYKDIRLKNLDR